MAVIWISHDLGVVAGFCRRVLVMYAGRVVESGPVEDIFARPLHPYNRALQRSIPALQGKGAELYTIPGLPPDVSKPLPACAFADRCEFAQPECRTGEMDLKEITPGHASACVRMQRGELKL
jgi:oligopeptide transport system ATP-binding protein